MKQVAVLLSGCGVYDGSEIQEAVLTLLYLDQLGASVRCFAPDREQAHVINHQSGDVAKGEKRNVLVEAARICRGKIEDLATLQANDFDALLLPGGFGAAKNLCSFAFDGANLKIEPSVQRVLKDFHAQKKPIGILCIAPVIAAKVLGASVTIGEDAEVADAIKAIGGSHVKRPVNDIHIDPDHNVVSAPAYMYDASIAEVAEGIQKLVSEVLRRA